jgi:hypothetical protein
MPCGSAGGVWERNEVLRRSVKVHRPALADHISQRVEGQELRDGQSAHREHQFGSKELKLAPQPVGALLNLEMAGDAVAAMRIFARKAAADRREVDATAHGFFIPAKCGLKPAEESLAGRPSERTTEDRFLAAWSLSNQENAAAHGASNHDRFVHTWTSAAVRQRLEVRAQRAHDPPKSTETIRKAR